jgi:hypothetical protein
MGAPANALPPFGIPAPDWAIITLFVDPTCSSAQLSNRTAIRFLHEHVVVANYRLEASTAAFAWVLLLGALAHAGGTSTPRGRVGTAAFVAQALCVGAQLLATAASNVSYVWAWASFSSAHARCLTPWRHGRATFDVVAFGTLGLHPRLLACNCLLVVDALVLVQMRRVWCAVRLGRDVGKRWAGLLPLVLAVLSFPNVPGLVFVGSLAVLFSLAFLPLALGAGGMLGAVGWVLRRLRQLMRRTVRRQQREGRRRRRRCCCWPPPLLEALRDATSFTAGMAEVFGYEGGGEEEEEEEEEEEAKDKDGSAGGLMAWPLVAAFVALCLSPLAVWGTPLAAQAYAGGSAAANTALVGNTYAAAVQGFRSADAALPLLDLDAGSRLRRALRDLLRWPQLAWGPERLMQNAGSMVTLRALAALLRCALGAATAALALCSVTGCAPNVPCSLTMGNEHWKGLAEVQKIANANADEPGVGIGAAGRVIREVTIMPQAGGVI